jgi:hypothetical protein
LAKSFNGKPQTTAFLDLRKFRGADAFGFPSNDGLETTQARQYLAVVALPN